jgi:hypothetical protein
MGNLIYNPISQLFPIFAILVEKCNKYCRNNKIELCKRASILGVSTFYHEVVKRG